MEIEMPTETTYYYECSYGDYRLIYHIPRAIVIKMIEKGKIKKEAKRDFPDGIDINCTTAEYDAFEAAYKYRPPLEPAELDRAFRGIFSTLDLKHPWEDYIGSGYVKASELENFSEDVEITLKEMKVKLPEEIEYDEDSTYEVKRGTMIERIRQQTVVEDALIEISPKIVERKFRRRRPPTRKSLRPKMSDGVSPGEVFSTAQRNIRRK